MKTWMNKQLFKFQQVFPISTLILLIINLSLQIYGQLEYRNLPFYQTTFSIMLVLFLCVWGFAHIYNDYFEMYKHKKLVEVTLYNPYQVYAFSPFEEVVWRTIYIPMLEEIGSKNVDKIKRWLDLGYIPKEDFPDHLKKYYLTKKPGRLQ